MYMPRFNADVQKPTHRSQRHECHRDTTDSKKPNTKQELITANIELLIEQLEAGHSEAFTNYLTAMSRFQHLA